MTTYFPPSAGGAYQAIADMSEDPSSGKGVLFGAQGKLKAGSLEVGSPYMGDDYEQFIKVVSNYIESHWGNANGDTKTIIRVGAPTDPDGPDPSDNAIIEFPHPEVSGTKLVAYQDYVTAALAAFTGKINKFHYDEQLDTETTTSTTFVDTALSVTLTPQADTTKIIVIASVGLGNTSSSYAAFARLAKGTDPMSSIGNAAGSRTRVGGASSLSTSQLSEITLIGLDTGVSGGQRTYTLQIASANGSGTACLNKTGGDANVASVPRGASVMLVIECKD